MSEPDAFQAPWALGYRRLVPIIPPDVELSPASSLSKTPKARGKAVGIKGDDGLWFSFDWTKCEAAPGDLTRWARMDAGVGLKAGPVDIERPYDEHLVFIDADTLNRDYAATILEIVTKHFGALPIRIGQYPKALYPIRVSGAVSYARCDFGARDPVTRALLHRVEILSAGKQAVMPPSVHPVTREPYYWARPLVALASLPMTSPEGLRAFLNELATRLPLASTPASPRAGAGAVNHNAVDQAALRGDPALVARAVAALPNTIEHFPSYDDMTEVGEAIHAALPDDADLGLSLFTEWCSRWEGGWGDDAFDPRLVEKWWGSYKTPHGIGAGYLYAKAARLGRGTFELGEVWFSDISECPEAAKRENLESLFEAPEEKNGLGGALRGAARFKLLTLAEAADAALAARARPLVRGLLDCGAMSVVYGAPGSGKSFVMLDLALAIASGRPYAGRSVTAGPVVYIAAEGGGVILSRVKALRDRYGEFDAEGLPAPFFLLPARVNLRDARADMTPLLGELALLEARYGRLALVVVDTLARALAGGDENSPVDMGAFIENCDRIRGATGAHCAVVHHTGKDVARGMRGHSSLLGALDSEIEIADGVIASGKQRDNESDARIGFRLRTVGIGFDAEGAVVKTAVVDLCDAAEAGLKGAETARLRKSGDKACLELVASMEERDARAGFVGTHSTAEIEGEMAARGTPIPRATLYARLPEAVTRGLLEKVARGLWRRVIRAKNED